MKMKEKISTAVLAVVASMLCHCAFAVTASTSSTIEPGVWNSNFSTAKAYAEKNGMPVLAVWSKVGCHFCNVFDQVLEKEEFKSWAAETGMVMIYLKARGDSDYLAARDWIRGKNTSFPFVCVYWKKPDGSEKLVRFVGRSGSYGGTAPKLIDKIKETIGDWRNKVTPTYVGGVFATEESEENRLEAESGTGTISVEMVRDGKVATVATNNLVKVIGPDGATVQTVNVPWAEGQTNQTISVDMGKVAFTSDGQKAFLVAVDADGSEQATNTVTYVTGSGSSPGNPLWIGERTSVSTRAASSSVLQFGEWTMDLDVAKEKVKAANGSAYTLVAVVGSLWCHDCANTERNFTSVADSDGNNKLIAWAKKNNVALVSIDIPNFTNNTIDCASPTLLSRSAYTTTLAYELPSYGMYDVSKGGAPESLTKPMMRSGLGYLTRKGVSDADARKVLERNHKLVTTDFTEGGFRTAADSNKFRTGVPIFVLLDKAGNVKARFTQFASVSPMADAKSKWDDVIKRFDEMLEIAKTGSAHADGGVIEDDFPGAGIHGIAASDGSVVGEISHCDLLDTYKLENFDGNALLLATAKGSDHAEVTLSIVKLGADGKKVTVASQAGVLDDGVMLVAEIETSGEFFVEISGAGDNDAFSAFNPATQAFHPYVIDCDVILIPGEMRSKAFAPKGSSTVSMLIEADALYRIEGLANDHGAALQKVVDNFYVSTVATEEGFSYEEMKTSSPGGTVVYQRWEPGVVGFVSEKKTVTESVGDVKVDFARELGMSGEVTVRVSLDESATTLYNSDGAARFEFSPVEFTWAEGESGSTNVVVTVKDDARFDGSGVVVLKLEVVSSENSDVAEAVTTYTLTVTEDDKQSAGMAAFTGVSPFYSKKLTVYAREGEGATIYADRFEASDGYVTAKVSSNVSGVEILVDGVATSTVVWPNHVYGRREITVKGIPAGKTAKITLGSPTDGLKVLSASNAVSVVSIAKDAPAFVEDSASATLYRYVAANFVYLASVGPTAAEFSVKKLSGTLPAGLSARWDATAGGLAVTGVTTAKAGVYTSVYQISQKQNSKTTPGMTLELTYTVVDPTDKSSPVVNPAVAAVNSRTFKDIAVFEFNSTLPEGGTNRLAGTLQVSIPKNGKVSAKMTCVDGTVSFTSSGWAEFKESSGDLSALLTSRTAGYSMTVVAAADGGVDAKIVSPRAKAPLEAATNGEIWSKNNNAEEWSGYFTATLINNGVNESIEGVAPRGNGFLTLKMATASAINSGTFTWAGMLPNGTSISGSAVLNKDDACVGLLPIFKRTSTDMIALAVNICDVVKADEETSPWWVHTDKIEDASYSVEFSVYGGRYSSTVNLAEACMAGYSTTTPSLVFDVSGLCGVLNGGGAVPIAVDPVETTVAASSIKAQRNAIGATLSFNRSTGVVSGTFKLPYTTLSGTSSTVSASYKGVVLLGWGADCGCDIDDGDGAKVVLPFVNGAFYLTDRMAANDGPKVVNISLKRGGAMSIGSIAE